MVKNIIAIIALSVFIILFTAYTQTGLNALMSAYQWISELLTQVFSGGKAGNLIRQQIAILCLPFLVALVPTLIYWFTRRKWFPYFMQIVWVIWLVEITMIVIQFKAAA